MSTKIVKNKYGLYKEPIRNRYFTQSLFIETKTNVTDWEPVYTLDSMQDTDDLISLPRLYMLHSDVTEYNFAVDVFGSYEHWEILCTKTWFKPYVERMRKELELSIKSQAIDQIKEKADGGDFNAIKYLASKAWRKDSLDTRTEEVGVKATDLNKSKQKQSVEDASKKQYIKMLEDDRDRISRKRM